ncbi:glycoside hydrolase family 97 N-terminal domain-containing protein [Massilia sp. B-10]|nr:glycoside hydrolase family 97 N-terminal domain-containing protein [Massilia sp. B-10]
MVTLKHVVLLALLFCTAAARAVDSPDGRIHVQVELSAQQTLVYSVSREGRPVLLPSALGLVLADADFAAGLTMGKPSAIRKISAQYDMAVGKRRHISYRANEQVFPVRARDGKRMDVAFRVSNDGVAFRYLVRGAGRKQFVAESTGFAFDPAARAWLQPMQVAQTGWMNTNPAYEEHYQREIAVGTASPSTAYWVFPALFKSGDVWVALSESNMDGSFHASRLQAQSPGGVYRIGLPMADERFTGGKLLADTTGDLVTPWRIIALGSLATVMDSTLGTDLAAPAIALDRKAVRPGHASWSWALLKDDATVYDVQKQFIDYAADMHWDYTLVDADWDRKIGYDKLRAGAVRRGEAGRRAGLVQLVRRLEQDRVFAQGRFAHGAAAPQGIAPGRRSASRASRSTSSCATACP